MKCLLKYHWVKLPRTHIPEGKGVLGYWARLASRAAFRNGQAVYCNYVNDVTVGTWSGGVVGLKSILGVNSRQKAMEIMDTLAYLDYIEYTLDPQTKKLTYKINDFVVKCSSEPCLGPGAVYITEGYGFLCLPRGITQRLAEAGYTFDEADAWLDLWCHTVFQDPNNIFSDAAPVVQYGQYGAVLTLENLGQRWGWEKTKVWRFLQKHKDAFALRKLPGSFGCLIFNILYPAGSDYLLPDQDDIKRILSEIRFYAVMYSVAGTDNERLNKQIAWCSKKLINKPFVPINESGESADSSCEALCQADNICLSSEKLISGVNAHLAETDYHCFKALTDGYSKKLTNIPFESNNEYRGIRLADLTIPYQTGSIRFIDEIIIIEVNTHITSTDSYYISELIAWYSRKPLKRPYKQPAETIGFIAPDFPASYQADYMIICG